MAQEDARRRRRLATGFGWRLAVALIGANTLGPLAVYAYLSLVVPDEGDQRLDVVNGIVFVSYLGAATLVGILGSLVVVRRVLRWFRADHVVDARDRAVVTRLPARVVRLPAMMWLIGVVVFGSINLADGPDAAFDVVLTVAAGGLTTCALSYLLAERAVRPLVAEVMRDELAPPPVVLGVRRRILLSWTLGTGVPVAGIALAALDLRGNGGVTQGSALFLSSVALVVGSLAMLVAARSVSEPVGAVTDALAAVADGDLTVTVAVDDVSEVGHLQSGVNAMVAGLRERQRLADLFGRHVGTDVAALALERGVDLRGERREVAVLFVDVVGSTGLAENLAPEEVVRRLNTFFGVVVEVITEQGGWVDKFEGDAALCVFGAPGDHDDPAGAALRAARTLVLRLRGQRLDAAVGVSAGPVVAGHVGTATRADYTVIGDPVNAAARLTDLAKTVPGRVLADAVCVERAPTPEQYLWTSYDEVVLRGRRAPTRVLVPRD